MSNPDKRLNATDADPATAIDMEIAVPVASLHLEPTTHSMQTTQALLGERIRVFAEQDGWLWCQLLQDGYVGFVSAASATSTLSAPTHRVAVPSTLRYPIPDIKSQPVVMLPMNARLQVVSQEGKFVALSGGGYLFAAHVKPIGEAEDDFVAVAECFLGVPYYWGGKTVQGLDCSGLVQTSLQACGIKSLRDTDMQENQLGTGLLINDLDGLRRGDLIFWNGHVGIMADSKTLLHANGHHMLTVKEPLSEAVQRSAEKGQHITSIRRF